MTRAPSPYLRRLFALGAGPSLLLEQWLSIDARLASSLRDMDAQELLESESVAALTQTLDLSRCAWRWPGNEEHSVPTAGEIPKAQRHDVPVAVTRPNAPDLVATSPRQGSSKSFERRIVPLDVHVSPARREAVLVRYGLTATAPHGTGGGEENTTRRAAPRVARPPVVKSMPQHPSAGFELERRAGRAESGKALHTRIGPLEAPSAQSVFAAEPGTAATSTLVEPIEPPGYIATVLTRLASKRHVPAAPVKMQGERVEATNSGLRGLAARFDHAVAGPASEPRGSGLATKLETSITGVQEFEPELADAVPGRERQRFAPQPEAALARAQAVPNVIAEAVSEADLERKLERILRRQAERNGINLSRRPR